MTDPVRTRTSLDGEWELLVAPDDRLDAADPAAAWPASATRTATVPHAWQELEGLCEYTGTVRYRRRFEYDGAGERAFLRFGAVDHAARVAVNGEWVGDHRGGYLPFEVEVTGALDRGENVLVVDVTDPENLEEVPHGKQGAPWYTRSSGIWQSVRLETRPAAYVEGIRATPDLEAEAATVEVDVDAPSGAATPEDDADAPATTAGSDADPSAATTTATVTAAREGQRVASATCEVADGTGTCRLSLPDPDLWTPAEPALYDLTVRLEAGGAVDVYEDYFGMRRFESDGDRFYLNGEPYFLRGALDQAYYPETQYRPHEPDLFEREVRTVKELGFNLLRKHIKPAHPDFLEAADRQGILVWEEPANPTVCTERSKRAVREQLRGLIERDYNRPSVVVWSLYNEEWGLGLDQQDFSDHPGRLGNDPDKQAYLAELYRDTRERDPTRLVCDNSGWAHVATDVNDYHEYYASPDRAGAWADALDDIVSDPGANYATERPDSGANDATERPDPSDAPVVVSEFGTWGFPDLPALRDHYGGDPPWFDHDFLDSPLKRAAGVDERFAATDLADVFGDYDALAAAWQRRQAASLAHVVERMRVRDGVAGYCVTEFSDIEWEFNGLLDYRRVEKPGVVDRFADVNDDLLVTVEPSRRAVAPGESASVDLRVVNDTNEARSGTLRWSAFGEDKEIRVTVPSFGTATVAEGVSVRAPPDAETGSRAVTATLETGDRTVSNEAPVAVVDPGDPPGTTVYADEPLATGLAEAGGAVTDDLGNADVALVTTVDDAVAGFVVDGGAAVVVPRPDGRMADEGYRSLPAGESWDLVASLLYQDSPLVDDLCPGARLGWAFADLYPYDLVTDVGDADAVHVGYVAGWLADWASPLVVSDRGDGRLCRCTFRVTDRYGSHPTATLLVHRLLERLG